MTAPRALAAVVLSLALAAGLGACGGDDDGDGTKVTTETSGPGTKNEGTAESFKARLTGDAEFPGPGVKDGVGAFLFDVTGTKGCYDFKVTMGEKPLKAHIHQGGTGASGPVVVDLMPTFEPGESALTAKSCVDLTGDVAAKLIADPAAYYVNVHSEAHPDGAIRGQLEPF
jgi:hypothetical protein